MKRNSFTDPSHVSEKRIWVGIGELWIATSTTDYDAAYIQSRNDEGDKERYLVLFLHDIKSRIELESHKVRGQRFLGVSANTMYESNWQRVDDSELSKFQNLLGKYDYVVTGGSDNLTKGALCEKFHNQGPIERSRILFQR